MDYLASFALSGVVQLSLPLISETRRIQAQWEKIDWFPVHLLYPLLIKEQTGRRVNARELGTSEYPPTSIHHLQTYLSCWLRSHFFPCFTATSSMLEGSDPGLLVPGG